MGALQTKHTPELRGLYANSNRFTQPQGTVPRLSNLYLIRRGAFHTVPGSKWISSFDGAAPHVTNQQPIVALQWYSPSSGSSPDLYLADSPAITPHNFLFLIQKTAAPGLELANGSGATFENLASQTLPAPPNHPGVAYNPTSCQFGDYLAIGMRIDVPPNIFPLYTVLTANAGLADTTITVDNTLPFPPTGYLLLDPFGAHPEAVSYTGLTPTTFTGLTRGILGTSAHTHIIGDGVENCSNTTPPVVNPWGPIINTFDPASVYSQWPGVAFSSSSSSQISVNIGTVIYEVDGNGVAWLFRAQNSGVTAYGATYGGPNFFPNSLSGNDGAISATSTSFTSATGGFTPAMVGLQITVNGAGAGGANLVTTVAAYVSSTNVTLTLAAGTTVTAAVYSILGVGGLNYSVKDYNPANGSGTAVWLNVGRAVLSPPGAAYVFQHLDYLFLWGVGESYGEDGITGADALWQSDFDTPTSFNSAFVTFAGKGDGTTAQGGAVYSLSEAGIAATPQLVLFKDASTYSFLNSFPNAALVAVSGGLGCIAPGTIQFIGGLGVMRLSYAGVTLFDGQLEHVTEYTDAIRGYLFGGITGIIPVDFSNIKNCVSTQAVNPPFYAFFAPLQGGSGYCTRGFAYDFGLKQWFIIDLPFPISAGGFFPQSVVATASSVQSVIAGATDGALRRLFAGDPDWDGTAINWSLQFPDWGFPGTPIYIRRLNPRISADGGGAAPAYSTATFAGVKRSGQALSKMLNVPKSILGTIDVGQTVLSGNVTIAGKGQVLIEGSDVQTSEKPMSRIGTG